MPFEPSIPAFALFSFESQASQYPKTGEPGISYFAGETEHGTVDCLLFRSKRGAVVGILNHYGFDSIWEKTGNVNVWVREDHQRRGIATALLQEAATRWTINLDQQRFTPDGVALAEKLRSAGTL